MGIAKRMTAFILMMALAFGTVLPLSASEEPEARLINIHDVLGEDVTLSRSQGGRSITPRGGQGLSDGNVLATGRDSHVYMQLDGISILKMDETSRVQVNATRNLLSLSVQAGAALVEVEQQQPEHSLEVLVGNTAFGVRGTSFIIGRRTAEAGDTVFVTMLSGEGEMRITDHLGEVMEVVVPAGAMLVVYEDREAEEVAQTHAIRYDFDVDAMGLFELREIYARKEQLLESGVLTPDMALELPGLVEQREAERTELRAQVDERLQQIAQAIATDVGTVPDEVVQAQPGEVVQGAQAAGAGGRVYLDTMEIEILSHGWRGGIPALHVFPPETGLVIRGVPYQRGFVTGPGYTSFEFDVRNQGFALLSGVFGRSQYIPGLDVSWDVIGRIALHITLMGEGDTIIRHDSFRAGRGERIGDQGAVFEGEKLAINVSITPDVHRVRITLYFDYWAGSNDPAFANAYFTTDPNDITVLP